MTKLKKSASLNHLYGKPSSLLPSNLNSTVPGATTYLEDDQKCSIHIWVGDGIVRTSIGLESSTDIIADLDQALNARTMRGVVGPWAYKVLRGKAK